MGSKYTCLGSLSQWTYGFLSSFMSSWLPSFSVFLHGVLQHLRRRLFIYQYHPKISKEFSLDVLIHNKTGAWQAFRRIREDIAYCQILESGFRELCRVYRHKSLHAFYQSSLYHKFPIGVEAPGALLWTYLRLL
jgi:hypothetical protein